VPPIFVVSGPPASGKTTLCQVLLSIFDRGLHIPVDDLRLWVVQGLSDSVPWTDETERQFRAAEESACRVAGRYHEEGFAVALDHCRNPERLDVVISGELTGLPVVKVLLLPSLDINLARNRNRTNKAFNPEVLTETIRLTNDAYRRTTARGWLILDNSFLSPTETADLILTLPGAS
jgi:hypothetical protein